MHIVQIDLMPTTLTYAAMLTVVLLACITPISVLKLRERLRGRNDAR